MKILSVEVKSRREIEENRIRDEERLFIISQKETWKLTGKTVVSNIQY